MIAKILLFLFFIASLQAALVQIDFSMGGGYRRDDFHYKNYASGNPDKINNFFSLPEINSAQQALYLNFIWDNFRLETEGDFGWIVTGKDMVGFPYNNGGPSLFFSFKNIYGYEADGMGSLGYTCSLYRSQFLDFDFVPFAGFKYWHLATRVKGNKTDNLAPYYGFTSFATYYESILQHADFWGPYLEGRLNFNFSQMVNLLAYYQYHFVFMRIKSIPTLNYVLEPSDATVYYTVVGSRSIIKDNNSKAQVGGLDIYFKTLADVLVGVRFYASRFYTHDAKTYTSQTTATMPNNSYFVSEDIENVYSSKVTWTTYSFVLYAGYHF